MRHLAPPRADDSLITVLDAIAKEVGRASAAATRNPEFVTKKVAEYIQRQPRQYWNYYLERYKEMVTGYERRTKC